MSEEFLHGALHQAQDDLRGKIQRDPALFNLWQNLTPLGRNEFICGEEDAKQAATCARRTQRRGEELLEGKKRPCCWVGCIHRTDKAPCRWQQDMLIDKKKCH